MPAKSNLKTVEDFVRDINADGISEDPVVHADGKGSDGAPYDSMSLPNVSMSCPMVRANLSLESSGRRKFALVFSNERWRFKIKCEHVMSAHLAFHPGSVFMPESIGSRVHEI